PNYPIKCDLCDGLPLMGCVHSCPTGAAIRIEPRELFHKTGAVTVLSRVAKINSIRGKRLSRATPVAAISIATAFVVGALTDPPARQWNAYSTGLATLGA